MAEIPENEFNDIFRQAAKSNEPPFDPKAWELMEKKLDREDRKVFWWRWGILLLIFIIAGSGFWYFYNSSDLATTQPKEKKEESITKKTSSNFSKNKNLLNKETPLEAINTNKTDTEGGGKTNLTIGKNIDSGTPKSKNTIEKSASKDILYSNSSKHTNKGVSNIKKTTPVSIIIDDASKEKPVNHKEKKEDENNKDKDISADSDDGNAKSEEIKEVAVLLKRVDFLKIERCTACEISLPEIKILRDSIPPPKSPSARKWIVGLTVAPDLSGINFGGNKVGARTSLGLDYALNSRLYITTGLGISKKRYLATSEEYTVPTGYWAGGDRPIGIDADCNVLEIPIGLRYDWWVRDKNKFFLASSISSFWMLKEVYEYEYDLSYTPTPGWKRGWEGSNENRHLFSVWQLGTGYEKQIGNKFFFQVEPFVQLPLGEIGFGKVDLTSFGTHFTLRYILK